MKARKKTILAAAAIAAVCVVIIAASYVLTQVSDQEFIPQPTPTVTQGPGSWVESTQPTAPQATGPEESEPAGTPAPEAPGGDEYPKTTVQPNGDVVIDFTDPAPSKEPAPDAAPAPSLPAAVPQTPQQPEDTPPNAPEDAPQAQTTPPNLGGHEGQVYDPVFGWLTPSEGEAIDVDSTGDPNKMVGTMD